MAELFSEEWMNTFMGEWNNESGLTDALSEINFNSTIAYGVQGEDQPRGVLKVEDGKVVSAGSYNGEDMNWDLRCSEDHWAKWMKKAPGMMGLGTAYTTGKLKFAVGDYGAMVKNPKMAAPFIKTFTVMGRV
ncbi:MAG: SCP-2 sterol transfer family protein [Gammaproteobacteria bacterium]|uniref:SCP-2 sterol transfer family protein n=1 Tax=Candidatus Thiopontia autotrophica TaxID=2841688 RepID=A0A8J6NWD5_9GAMM|nr:SCP-2 sterol transfer family protein [Candidatus Thiopontia autotrophica]